MEEIFCADGGNGGIEHSETNELKLVDHFGPNSQNDIIPEFSSSENDSDDKSIDFLSSHNAIKDDNEQEEEKVEELSNGYVVNELIMLRGQNKSLQSEILNLQKEISRLEADRSAEMHIIQVEGLEKTIVQQKKEIHQLQETLKQQADVSQRHILQIKQDYESKIDRINKKLDTANKERESMVMKYAVSEKSVIDLKKEVQSYEGKIKDMIKEKEAFQTKLKTLTAEKIKLNQLLDSKVNELAMAERENQKRKDEIQMRDSKIKWAQNRLKSEMDSHAETQTKMEKMSQKLNEIKEEMDQFKKHTQAIIRSYQEAQEDKNNQEQEEKAKLIIDKHDEETLAKVQQEVEKYKKKQKTLLDENNQLGLKVQNLEKEKLEYEYKLSDINKAVDDEKRTVIDLLAQLSELESIKYQLQHEQERLITCQTELDRLRTSNGELEQEMESCREREAELLEFTQKLTEKNVRLQSEFTAVEARAHQLQIEHSSCQRDIGNLESTVASLTKELEREKIQRQEEKELLMKRLAEQTEKSNTFMQEVADQQGENQLLKKKHLVALKELSKELNTCRKRLETYEISSASLGESSRTSSNASLNTVETNENKTVNNQISPTNSTLMSVDLDPQILINKIIEIQKSNARKSEKVEFLKEHVKQLVTELQKKTRIIQSYVLREQTGVLASETMDNYKSVEWNSDKRKVALSKYGGIMASVYNSKAVDEGMTLEFSLKINKKLQAVLEDTLLKNITLKENIETLGNEIARLTASKTPYSET